MSDVNPPVGSDDNPHGSVDDQGVQPNGSDNQSNGQDDVARRLQSERDKARSDAQKLEERLEALEGDRYANMRDEAAKTFLSEAKDKYPDVEVTDMAFATSPEDFEELAKKAQDKYDRVRNRALEDVQKPIDTSLSDEEADKRIEELRKGDERPKGSFSDFLNVQFRRKR